MMLKINGRTYEQITPLAWAVCDWNNDGDTYALKTAKFKCIDNGSHYHDETGKIIILEEYEINDYLEDMKS